MTPSDMVSRHLYGTAEPGLLPGTMLPPGAFGRRLLESVVLEIENGMPVIPNPGETGVALYEMAFEIVRLREFPDLPSRFHCSFFWMNEASSRHFHSRRPWPAELYEVEVVDCRSVWLADMNLISYFEAKDTISQMMDRARRYWQSVPPAENLAQTELLLDGTARIVRSLAGPLDNG